jgi:tRNA nucleotidyltransferase/poly(A) polymerase
MQLKDLLSLVVSIAKEKGITEPFIVGGTPRDKVMNRLENISDLDITNGDQSIHSLAREVAIKLGKAASSLHFEDHSSITVGSVKLDFSSNFMSADIKKRLQRAGLKNPAPMLMELYSRDFTVNALLMTMDLQSIKDPTGMGLKDIKRKLIRTCLPAPITLRDDPKRIVRSIYLGAKLGFDLDDEIVRFVKKHPDMINEAKADFVTKKITEAHKYDKERTYKLLDQLDLWKKVKINKELISGMIQDPKRI